MINLNVVIGANYGDEGKGLVTNYLTTKYDSGIILLNNGGAQRGHTVETKNGFRHVFHHFGSTVNPNFISHCTFNYIVNPAICMQEYYELIDKLQFSPKMTVSHKAIVSTPFDMMLNQMVELNRKDEKHGSVGVGIWETLCRHKVLPLFYEDTKFQTVEFRNAIINYFLEKLNEYDISNDIQKQFLSDLDLNKLYGRFAFDLIQMKNKFPMLGSGRIFFDTKKCSEEFNVDFNNIIIENGQGLLLDQTCDTKHATPSYTGLFGVKEFLETIIPASFSLTAHYVSRSYLTRHGAGSMENEVNKSDISDKLFDKTNVYNDYQGELRYGKLNGKKLKKRIENDIKKFKAPYKNSIYNWSTRRLEMFQTNLYLTHLNEVDYNYIDIVDECSDLGDIYVSDDIYPESIIKCKG